MENHTAEHRQFTIDRTNVEGRLAFIRHIADDARRHGDREGAAHLDLLAADLNAWVAAGWRDHVGSAVDHWEFHFWVSSLGNGSCSLRIQLRPIRRAA